LCLALTTCSISSLILLPVSSAQSYVFLSSVYHLFLTRISSLTSRARTHTKIYKTCRSGRFRHAVLRRAQSPVTPLFPSLSLSLSLALPLPPPPPPPPALTLPLSDSLPSVSSLFSLHLYFCLSPSPLSAILCVGIWAYC
jgi:hypothetical protein